MKLTATKVWVLAALVVGLLAVTGCKGHVEKNAEGDTTSVGVKTDPGVTEATKDAGNDMADATHEAGQDMKEGMDKAGDSMAAGADNAAAATGDAAITAKVKTKLLADPEVGGLKINVDTLDGKVTLTGTAESAAQKTEAGKLAKNTEGVSSVDNQITIGMK
jgi:hyperosmotically inducible protein